MRAIYEVIVPLLIACGLVGGLTYAGFVLGGEICDPGGSYPVELTSSVQDALRFKNNYGHIERKYLDAMSKCIKFSDLKSIGDCINNQAVL